MNLQSLLKDSQYSLTQFSQELITEFEKTIFLKSGKSGDVPYINCLVRNKEIKLTPEEIVRQLYLKVLIDELHYPVKRIVLEHPISFGREKKRADIVIFDKDRPDVPYIIVELKKPKLKDGKEQLKSYCNATGAPIAVWTNGEQISYYHRKDPNYFEEITHIPNAKQKLSDVFNEKFSLADLIAKDKQNTKSLKNRILEMEDEVLANAGVDVFEECFKLIFIKLFDELESGRNSKRYLQFRNIGTEQELKNNIKTLFDSAKKKWHGVFSDDAEVELSFSHLPVCVSYLQDVKLFNSNLDVIDEAFEYLINKSSKGEKGQYFTPRYVIDMCVKMLNPREYETMIDTAAGSAGFTMHSIFHVWRQILDSEGLQASHLFTLEKKPSRCEDYVKDKVFAIDFDEKAVRVARTLNLIAGDGETNVLHLNTLDYERWEETTQVKKWQKTYFKGWFNFQELAKKKDDFKQFEFDVLMANPPFAGDIKESRIIHKYELAQKNDKWQSKVGRDILFIERNLDFLKPGGRMAIVLPQGRFNNSSDKYIREFIAERCRILAVIGLHGNTFKPHTGTKTSVLLVQKWDDLRCPKRSDYPIFFATMQKSGKDNSGEKIELKNADGSFKLDTHGHRIIDHDLFNHEGLTQDGIAEAFIEFAKKERLSFFELGSFNEAKYNALLEGLEISILMLSEVFKSADTLRLDSDFYLKKYLKIEHLIKNRLTDFISFNQLKLSVDASAFYPALEPYYGLGSFPFIRVGDVKNQVDFENCIKIPCEILGNFPTLKLVKKGDIVLTKGGTIAKAGLITQDACVSRDLIYINSSKLEEKYYIYLYLYFSTNFAYHKLVRSSSQSVQPHLTTTLVKNLLILNSSIDLKSKLAFLYKSAHSKLEESKLTYTTAENLLLEELGLKNWQPSQANIAIKSFSSSFLSSGRLDAEYYQPKYDELENKIAETHELAKLKDFLTLNQRGTQPDYSEKGLPVINSKHVQKDEVLLTDNRFATLPNKKAPLYIKKFDVLVNGTGVGTIGRSACYLHEQNAIPDNHVTILRTNKINPIYLSI